MRAMLESKRPKNSLDLRSISMSKKNRNAELAAGSGSPACGPRTGWVRATSPVLLFKHRLNVLTPSTESSLEITQAAVQLSVAAIIIV